MKTTMNTMTIISIESTMSNIKEKRSLKASITTSQTINRKSAMNLMAMPKRKNNEIVIE